jgi:ribose transport system permease protein
LAVVTVGTTFVLFMGAIDLSMEGIIGTGVMVGAVLVANTRNDNNLGLAGILAVLVVGAAFGTLNGVILTKVRIPSLMATLGVSAVGLGIGTMLFAGTPITVADPILVGLARNRWFGFTAVTYVALGAVVIGWLIQKYTRVGRYAYAIGGAEDVIRLSGVNLSRYKVFVFALAGLFYGLGALLLLAQLGSGVVQAGAGLNFSSIAAAVVGGTLLSGGRGGVVQSTIGVLVLTVLGNGLVLVGVSSYVQNAVLGVAVVVAVAATTWPIRRKLGVVK